MNLSEAQQSYIISKWPVVSNIKIAAAVGLTPHQLRQFLYAKGMKKQTMEKWTDEQEEFLKANFRAIGDKELAKMFASRWPKSKGWTFKHIEKKRLYLNLKRSKSEIAAIKQRNIRNGNWSDAHQKIWDKRGVLPDGTIRYWRRHKAVPSPYIKVSGKFVPWARWRYEQLHGPIPEKMNVIFLDNNPRNRDDSNLALLSNAQLADKISQSASIGLSDNYIAGMMCHKQPELKKAILKNHPELIELKRLQLNLNRKINEKL